MSGPRRPQGPRISTDVHGQNLSKPPYSPSNGRQPAKNSPVQPSSTNSRKRPAEPRSRGHSPPEKRSRPPERSLSTHNRHANTEPPSNLVSPPRSRQGSRAGLPDSVPTGPRRKSIDGQNNDSFRSGPAPRVPSMLPSAASGSALSGAAQANHKEQQKPEITGGLPPTLAALQSLKRRKLAIANAGKPKNVDANWSSSQIAQLQAQQMKVEAITQQMKIDLEVQHTENVQLKKINEQLLDKMKSLESLPSQMEELKSRLDRASTGFESIQILLAREGELNQLKALVGRVESLETKTKQHATQLDDVSDLKTNIETIKQWKEVHFDSKLEFEERIKAVVLQEIGPTLEAGINTMRTEMKAEHIQLDKRIQDEHRTIMTLSSGFNSLTTFKKSMEQQNTSDQLSTLLERVKHVEQNEAKSHNIALRLADDMHDFIGPAKEQFELNNKTVIGRVRDLESKFNKRLFERIDNLEGITGQVEKVQSEQGRLSNEQTKLTQEKHDLLKDVTEKLAARVDKVEQKSNGLALGSTKAGATDTEPLVIANNASTIASAKRLDKIDKDIKELRESCKGVQILVAHATNVDSRLELMNGHSEKLNILTAEISRFNRDLTTLESRVSILNTVTTKVEDTRAQTTAYVELQSKVSELQLKFSELETCVRTDPELPTKPPLSQELIPLLAKLEKIEHTVELLQEDLIKVQSDTHNQSLKIGVLDDVLPELFTNAFDPFKRTVQFRLDQLSETINTLNLNMARPQQQPSQTQSPAVSSLAVENYQALKQDMTKMQAAIQNETLLREQGISHVTQQLGHKIDSATFENALDHVKGSFQGLQDQYNNISTDELHGKMVQWFVQNYPSNTANMFQQFATIQQEVQGLQTLSAEIAWIQSQSSGLAPLIQNASQLQALLQSSAQLHQLPQIRANTEIAIKNTKELMAKAGAVEAKTYEHTRHIEATDAAVKRLEYTLHNLNSDLSPFVKVQAMHDFEKRLENQRMLLEKRLTEESEACSNAKKEFQTSAGIEFDKLTRETQQTQSSLDSCIADYTDLRKHIDNVQLTVTKLRYDVNIINTDFIAPNGELFGMFPDMIRLVGQFQFVLEQINQNLPKGPLRFQWLHDLRPPEEKNGDVDGSGSGSGKARNKSKSKQ